MFKLLMGIDVQTFMTYADAMQSLDETLREIKVEQIMTTKALLVLQDQTGGEGWIEAVQNAIQNLDARTYKLQEIISAHQEAFEEMAENQTLLDLTKGNNIN